MSGGDKFAWQDEGLCLDEDPALFVIPKGKTGKAAKAICNGVAGLTLPCPVREQCLEHWLSMTPRTVDYGVIVGGTDERERRRMRRERAS